MEKTLLIVLLVVEIVAFGWLIIEAKISRKQRETILEVEKQILNLEKTIIAMERTIIQKVSNINDFTKRERLLLDNEKLIKNNGNKL
jgi:cell division protein FtsL